MQDLNDKINNGGATSDGQLSSNEWNQLPSEVQNAILSGGETLSGGNLSQLAEFISSMGSSGQFFIGAGTVNAYTALAIAPRLDPPALIEGMIVSITCPITSTAASTLSAFGLGVLPIHLDDSATDILAGDMEAGIRAVLRYSEVGVSHYILENPQTSTASTSTALDTGAFLQVRDEKASGTHGGSVTAAIFETRDLNTEVTNTIAGASLASDKITLPAGDYYIEASTVAYRTDATVAKLRNVTDSADLLIGTAVDSDFAASDAASSVTSHMSGLINLAAEKDIEIQQYYASSAIGTLAKGSPVSAGVVEVYADVKIWKV